MFPTLFILGFFVVFAIMCVSVKKKANQNKTDGSSGATTRSRSQSDDGYSADNSGLTPSQRAYLNGLRARNGEQRTAQNGNSANATTDGAHKDNCPAVRDAHAHDHVGFEEHYAPIEGSLGSVDDEGCADLSGVRLIENDPDYAPTTDYNDVDRKELARIMILGEVFDRPAWKGPYTRK